jgi:hypothetical protein
MQKSAGKAMFPSRRHRLVQRLADALIADLHKKAPPCFATRKNTRNPISKKQQTAISPSDTLNQSPIGYMILSAPFRLFVALSRFRDMQKRISHTHDTHQD